MKLQITSQSRARLKWFALVQSSLILAASLSQAGDGPFINDDRIKTCLLQAFSAQIEVHEKTEAYTSKLSDLGLSDSRYCHGIELKITQATKSKFKIVAHGSTLAWVVNQAKVLKKLK